MIILNYKKRETKYFGVLVYFLSNARATEEGQIKIKLKRHRKEQENFISYKRQVQALRKRMVGVLCCVCASCRVQSTRFTTRAKDDANAFDQRTAHCNCTTVLCAHRTTSSTGKSVLFACFVHLPSLIADNYEFGFD